MDLVRKTKIAIVNEGLAEAGNRILVACSGGLDSVVLLYVLREISHDVPLELGIAHVNHMLRGQESERDEDFVKGLADRFSLPCYVKRVDVRDEAKKEGKSIQHAARDARYAFLDEIANNLHFDKIAVAHTLDDQVETFLLRLIKGTGIRGLSAIPVKRGRIIRPFLLVYRREIEEYAAVRAISHVEDSTNAKTVYERNFVRREIVPIMERLNPAVKEKIVSLLHDLTLVNGCMEKKANDFFGAHVLLRNGEARVDMTSLKGLDDEVRYRVISRIINKIHPHVMPLREHVRLVGKIMAGRGPNLSLTLPVGITVRKSYKEMVFTGRQPKPPFEGHFRLQLGVNIIDPLHVALVVAEMDQKSGDISVAPTIAYLDFERLGKLSVRTFRPGDRFVPLGMKSPIKIKDFFIRCKIPIPERRHIPLVLSDDDIVWIVGHRIDDRYRVTQNTRRVLRITAEFKSETP